MTTGLSAVLGNDPVILSGTAFLVYFTKIAEVSPTAWIFSEFVTCNTASMLLFVGMSPCPFPFIACGSWGDLVFLSRVIVCVTESRKSNERGPVRGLRSKLPRLQRIHCLPLHRLFRNRVLGPVPPIPQTSYPAHRHRHDSRSTNRPPRSPWRYPRQHMVTRDFDINHWHGVCWYPLHYVVS